MSQSEKSAYYAALKESGVSFDTHSRDYTTVELKKMYAEAQLSADLLKEALSKKW